MIRSAPRGQHWRPVVLRLSGKFQLLNGRPHPSALARLLADQGLSVREVTTAPRSTTVHARSVPNPLPAAAYDLLVEYAKEGQSRVLLEEDDGTVIEWGEKGGSALPHRRRTAESNRGHLGTEGVPKVSLTRTCPGGTPGGEPPVCRRTSASA